MKEIDVLIPTYNRPQALAVTLTALCAQEEKSFNVIISNQGKDLYADAAVKTVCSLLEQKGHRVQILLNLPRLGMAQQRQFLFENSSAPYLLYLDDDVLLEPFVLKIMKEALQQQQIGFVGCPLIGLSYTGDERPHECAIEFWPGQVEPETVVPESAAWQRYKLHNAANPYHVQKNLSITPSYPRLYKVAWVGGCVLYDRRKLQDCGAFTFWDQLPQDHCGEDVLAQLRVMKKWGGCGILPSGAYHLELETSIPNRQINAPQYLEI